MVKTALAIVALLIFAGLASAQCASYGESCSATGGCCQPLECTGGKCNQPPTTCTNLPSHYVFTPTVQQLTGAGSPLSEIGNLSAGTGIIPGAYPTYKVGWFSDWNTNGVLAVLMVVSIIAMAAMVGHAFNLPDVKAFAESEIIQAVVSIMLVAGLLALVAFFDGVAREAVAAANLPINCASGEPCYVTAAKHYLDTLYSTAEDSARNALRESIKLQRAASQGYTLQANWYVLLYAGASIRPNAGMSIKGERAGIIFETVSRVMASLHAQRYFIDVIAYAIAPIFLLLGIVLRTFFFTRRLGGLLLAIAISLFIIYPLTYAFAWYTLNVTVYGERTFSTPDPKCPRECTTRYPVAFFINNSTGDLVAFETTQDIVLAGINASNWKSGNVDADAEVEFPGLVACQDLSSIGISQSIAPNQCKGCPDMCREVPFPNIEGCNVTACSLCNPGCKIMRVRSDCRDPTVCNCPSNCRVQLPVENKCYDINEGQGTAAYVQADLNVSCAGCEGCPMWCRLLDSNKKLVYENEAACKVDACKLSNCPIGCMYKTEIGKTANCDQSCTYSDSSGTYTCPKSCRVSKIFPYNNNKPADEAWVNTYDIGAKVKAECTSDPRIVKACNNCLPECLISVPEPNTIKCAGYPTNTPPKNCSACPLYCRWSSYSFLDEFINAGSNIPLGSGGMPYMCTINALPWLNCSTASCGSTCLANEYPRLCKDYSPTGVKSFKHCDACPLPVRVTLVHPNYNGPPAVKNEYGCLDANCPPGCRKTLTVPGAGDGCEDYNPTGNDVGCTRCPIACRLNNVNNVDYLDNSICANCANCPSKCKAGPDAGAVCEPYLGNGKLNQDAPMKCYGPANCTDYNDESLCEGNAAKGCMWLQENSSNVPIIFREAPFNNVSNCKQCPENCRINGGAGCEGEGITIDCSDDACSPVCKKNITTPEENPACGEYVWGLPNCRQCPALCRRQMTEMPQACLQIEACSAQSCSEECRLAPAPITLCDSCFECPMDCLYKPGVRTDCAEVCSDEALAGPANIAPDDFIRALPGAEGELDVRGAGLLLVPALVLPMFNIVIVVAFIRVFSPTLGGDIEIPGLSKII